MLAVLISGGLDSAILLGDVLRRGEQVWPLFTRFGLVWEHVELLYLSNYLEALAGHNLEPLTILDQPVGDLYGDHWSRTGRDVPDSDSPDEAVYLPGRNVLLLAKAMIWCHLNRVPAIALGALATNPFPDAKTEFFHGLEETINRAVGGAVRIVLPYGTLTKREVMQLGHGLPLQFTFSCIKPEEGLHCGRCNKCAERRHAFADAGIADPTQYATAAPPCISPPRGAP